MPSEAVQAIEGLVTEEIERLQRVLAILRGEDEVRPERRPGPRKRSGGGGRPGPRKRSGGGGRPGPRKRQSAGPTSPSPAATTGNLKDRAFGLIQDSPGITHKQLAEALELPNPESTYLYTVTGELKKEKRAFRDGNGWYPAAPAD